MAELVERLSELDIVALVNALAVTIWKLDNVDVRLRQLSNRVNLLEQDLVDEEER